MCVTIRMYLVGVGVAAIVFVCASQRRRTLLRLACRRTLRWVARRRTPVRPSSHPVYDTDDEEIEWHA